jgi:hypothetical protein
MHELQHDEECTEMQRIIVDWISRRVGRAQPVGCLPAEFNVRYVQKSKLIGRKRLAVIILFIVLWHLGIIYKYALFTMADCERPISSRVF